jgi:hypothetical protein
MVDAGTPFAATDEDWLQDSVMVVKNVSKREVVEITLTLYFPEAGDATHQMVADQVAVGTPPPQGIYTRAGKKLDYPAESSLSLGPGQTLEIPLGQHFAGNRKLLEQRKALREFSTCRVRFAVVYFANGMKWGPGYFGRPDPDHLGQYIQMLPSEFYGYQPLK